MSSTTAIALTIAGSDSGGGAGIQADLKTFAALGVFGCSAITALTAQNTCGVFGVHNVPAEFVRAQIRAVLQDINVGAIKTGMLSTAEIIQVIADELKNHTKIPLVIDPVMIATSGDKLIDDRAIDILIKQLLPVATLVTPNLHEAAALTNSQIAKNLFEMREQAKNILAMGPKGVLMKGGHADSADATDLLITHDQELQFVKPRIATKNSHGTGCTLAAAIAAGLAKKLSLEESVKRAKDYLHNALLHADELQIGKGHGPVNHFYFLK